MDISQLLMERRKIRKSTADQYIRTLSRLSRDIGLNSPATYDWICDEDTLPEIVRTLDGLTVSGQLVAYAALMVVLCVLYDDNHSYPVSHAREIYDDKIKSLNKEKRETDNHQDLRGKEQGRWKSYDALERNTSELRRLSAEAPLDALRHFKFLLYALFIYMKDICALRLDVVYTTRLTSVPIPGENYFLIPPSGAGFLVMNTFKTSNRHGEVRLTLPTDFVVILRDSYDRFPRSWFIPSSRDYSLPLHVTNASKLVKQAWVLSKSSDGPTADDIRSAVTTRFFVNNPSIIARDAFAARSMSSRDTMERCYYKL